jgi:hypothetical protein
VTDNSPSQRFLLLLYRFCAVNCFALVCSLAPAAAAACFLAFAQFLPGPPDGIFFAAAQRLPANLS